MQGITVGLEREAFRDALVRVVAEHGWRGTTVTRVATVAGLPPERFYDCYRSLEECYVAAFDRMVTRAARTARRAAADAGDPADGRATWERRLEALLGGVLAFFALEPALARACLVECDTVGPLARARRDAALDDFASHLEGLWLEHGVRLPRLASEVIACGTVEAIRARAERGDTDGLAELLPQLRPLWLGDRARRPAPSAAPVAA